MSDALAVSDAFKPPRTERLVIWQRGGRDRDGDERDFAAGALFYYDNTAPRITGNLPPWRIEGWLFEAVELDDGRLRIEMEVTAEDYERIMAWVDEHEG